jgi:hypothetical protein
MTSPATTLFNRCLFMHANPFIVYTPGFDHPTVYDYKTPLKGGLPCYKLVYSEIREDKMIAGCAISIHPWLARH